MDYELIRSKRRTLSIEILPEGRILVRAPKRLPENEIDSFIKQKESWIKKHLEKLDKQADIIDSVPEMTEDDIKELKKQARTYFPDRVKYYAELMGVTYGRITIKYQKTLWGSCSAKGNLNFNCLLMRLPVDIRDYVIVHELSHRKYMDHSNAFWMTVESTLPDYKERRTILKKDGSVLMRAAFRGDEKDSKEFYTYILRCADGSLYTGYTTDLEARVNAHNSGKGAKYTRTRLPVSLVYYETFNTKQDAQRREALIKQMGKREKEKLIKAPRF